VATNYEARIVRSVVGVTATVVDGDQRLWLRAGANMTISVPGVTGEPFLRFDSGGVWVNRRSLTAQSDGVDRLALVPSSNARTQPLWARLTKGHAYRWHEHRLHAGESAARAGRHPTPWAIPLTIDGRRTMIAGVLRFRSPPTAWRWAVAGAGLALAASIAAWRSTRATVAVGAMAALAVWSVRAGRELYGRPGVGASGYLTLALTCAVGVLLLAGLASRDRGTRLLCAFLAGTGAVYQGLTSLPAFTHAVVLSVLPSTPARVGLALAFALGTATLAGGVVHSIREETP
jgi:hypothetical protein